MLTKTDLSTFFDDLATKIMKNLVYIERMKSLGTVISDIRIEGWALKKYNGVKQELTFSARSFFSDTQLAIFNNLTTTQLNVLKETIAGSVYFTSRSEYVDVADYSYMGVGPEWKYIKYNDFSRATGLTDVYYSAYKSKEITATYIKSNTISRKKACLLAFCQGLAKCANPKELPILEREFQENPCVENDAVSELFRYTRGIHLSIFGDKTSSSEKYKKTLLQCSARVLALEYFLKNISLDAKNKEGGPIPINYWLPLDIVKIIASYISNNILTALQCTSKALNEPCALEVDEKMLTMKRTF